MKNKKKIYKIVIMIPILFSLSGCSAWWGYNHGGMMNWNFNEALATIMMDIQLWFFWNTNKALILTDKIVRNFLDGGPWFVIKMMYGLLDDFKFLSTIVTIVSVLAVGSIIVKAAYTIFKTYFLNIDGQHAAPTLDFFKRIMYSLIVVLLAPQLIITSFVGSNLIAAAAGTQIITSSQAASSPELFQLYDDVENYGLELGTYCKDNLVNDGQSSGVAFLKNDASSAKIKVLSSDASSVGSTLYANNNKIIELNNNYCKDGARRVGEYVIFKDDNFKSQWYYAKFGGVNIRDDSIASLVTADLQVLLDSLSSGVAVLLSLLVSIIFIGCALLMTSFRVAELVSSIIMLWFYASSYISEVKNNQLGEFVKQVIAICVTQMYTVFIFAVYISFTLSAGSGLMETFMGFALLCLMWKGGNTVKNALSSSGAASGAGAVASVTSKAISKL